MPSTRYNHHHRSASYDYRLTLIFRGAEKGKVEMQKSKGAEAELDGAAELNPRIIRENRTREN